MMKETATPRKLGESLCGYHEINQGLKDMLKMIKKENLFQISNDNEIFS